MENASIAMEEVSSSSGWKQDDNDELNMPVWHCSFDIKILKAAMQTIIDVILDF